MIELPKDIQDVLDLAYFGKDETLRQYAWKLLSSKMDRYGLRWEYFV